MLSWEQVGVKWSNKKVEASMESKGGAGQGSIWTRFNPSTSMAGTRADAIAFEVAVEKHAQACFLQAADGCLLIAATATILSN